MLQLVVVLLQAVQALTCLFIALAWWDRQCFMILYGNSPYASNQSSCP